MGVHMIGLSTLHRRLSHIVSLVDKMETVIVHSGGKWLFQLVSPPNMVSQNETLKVETLSTGKPRYEMTEVEKAVEEEAFWDHMSKNSAKPPKA